MIWISDAWKDYEVLDTSNGERLERWVSIFWFAPILR